MGKHKGYSTGQKSTTTHFKQSAGNPHAGTGTQSGVSGALLKGIKLIFRDSSGKKQK